MDRDEKGRFVPGNKASRNGGRPSKPREERYYEILMTACTFADWERIVKKAVDQAKRGNPTARKWLSDYLVGTPKQNVEHSGKIVVVSWDADKDQA